MKLNEIYSHQDKVANLFFVQKKPIISFEVFPPKGDDFEQKVENLCNEMKILKLYRPSLISITHGAGGSNVENSLEITQKMQQELNLTPMPHFTCICRDKTYIENYLQTIVNMGIENILALRGDMTTDYEETDSEFRYASDLVRFIKSKTNLSIGVAGYPEGHSECVSLEKDIENLKKKVDEGADVIYTQLFFDNTNFDKYVQLVRDAGITIPIIPGILPISSYSQLEKMVNLCKTVVPKSLSETLEKNKNNPEDIKKIGIEYASYQCQQLIDMGVNGLHFYCLNKSEPVRSILENIL